MFVGFAELLQPVDPFFGCGAGERRLRFVCSEAGGALGKSLRKVQKGVTITTIIDVCAFDLVCFCMYKDVLTATNGRLSIACTIF